MYKSHKSLPIAIFLILTLVLSLVSYSPSFASDVTGKTSSGGSITDTTGEAIDDSDSSTEDPVIKDEDLNSGNGDEDTNKGKDGGIQNPGTDKKELDPGKYHTYTDSLTDLSKFLDSRPLASGNPSDLGNFITNVTMLDSNGDPVTNGDTVYTGEDYTFVIRFDEQSALQFKYGTSPAGTPNVLWYQLPAALEIQEAVGPLPVIGGNDANGNPIVLGQYTISTSGLVEVHFDNVYDDGTSSAPTNFIDNYANAFFTLSITAQLNSSSGDTDLGIGDIVVNVQPPDPGLSVEKTSNYDSKSERIYYQTKITALNDTAGSIKLVDSVFINNKVINNPLDNSAVLGFKYAISTDPTTYYPMSVTWVTPSDPKMFTYDFGSLQLAENDSIIVSYFVDIPILIENNPDLVAPGNSMNYEFDVQNDVAVTSDNGNGNDSTDDKVQKTFSISKSGQYGTDGGDPASYWIDWTNTIGDGQTRLNSSGSSTYTIEDTLGTGMSLPLADDITVKFYNVSGSLSGTYPLSDFFLTIIGNTFSFDMPQVDDSTYGNVYKVIITYRTSIQPPPKPGQPPIHYDNNIIYNGPDGEFGSTGTVPFNPTPVTITKDTSHIYCGNAPNAPSGSTASDYFVDYTVKVDIPAGLYDQALSINDTLVLSNGPTVTNNPSAIASKFSVTAFDTNNPGTTYTIGNTAANDIMYYLTSSGNSWQMFLGTTVSPSSGLPSWPVQFSNVPVTITINYTVRLTSYVSNLQNGSVLTNTAQFQNGSSSNAGSNTTISSSVVRDSWPITKTVTPSANQPSLFNYKVTINGNNPYPFFVDPNTGNATTALFSDTFDQRLEYVSKSFYVIDRNTGKKYTPNPDATVTTTTTSNDTIKADFATLQPTSSPPWYANNHTFDVYYQLQLRDDPADIANDAGYKNMDNTATVTRGLCEFSNDASVDYDKPAAVGKTMNPNPPGSNIVDVVLIINPEGKDYPDGGPSLSSLIAEDTMSSNLTPILSSIAFFTQGETPPGSGRWDGVWQSVPVNPPPSTAIWSYDPVSQNVIDFVLPNAKPIMIRYQAQVTTPVGETADINNEIHVEGVGDDSVNNSYLVNDSNAGAGGSRSSFTLYKRNNNGDYLSGAQFELYIGYLASTPPYGFYGPPPPTKKLNVYGNDFYYVKNGVTKNGQILFDDSRITSSFKYVFMLVETKAPNGYVLPTGSNAFTFFVLPNVFGSGEMAALEGVYGNIDTLSDFINITNITKKPTKPKVPSSKKPGGDNNLKGEGAGEPKTDDPFDFINYITLIALCIVVLGTVFVNRSYILNRRK